MSSYPFPSPGLHLLLTGLRHGDFDKAEPTGYRAYDEGCCLCKRRANDKMAEVRFSFPREVTLRGTDIPFDLTVEMAKLCLPCLVKLGDMLGERAKDLQPLMAFARQRIEADKATVYVPAAIEDDGDSGKAI
jgi:hypothetical protein